MTVNVQWKGGVPTTEAYLVADDFAPFGFACGGGGTLVSSGQGANDSCSPHVTPCTSYLFYGCNGSNPKTLSLTLTLSGGTAIVEMLGGRH